FREVLLDNVNQLKNLKNRIEITEGGYFQYWNSDASLIIEQEPSFKFIEWIDSTMVIRRVEPYEGNEEAVGLDISKLDYRNSDWNKAKADSIFNLTHWMELVQGDRAFLVDAPVYIEGTFMGTITAGLDFTDRFNEIMQGLDEYHVELRDEKGTLFYSFGDEDTVSYSELRSTHEIAIGDAATTRWEARITPNSLFAETNSISVDYVILALALTLCLLLAMSTNFMLKASTAEKTARNANSQLAESLHEKEILLAEIHHRVKNNLAIIIGLIELHKSEVTENELSFILNETQNRIYSISGVHELLYETENFSDISFNEYIEKLVHRVQQTYGSDERKITISRDLHSFSVNINQAIPLGLLLNELITNSFKHAFRGMENGRIYIGLEESDDSIAIIYRDNGSDFDVSRFEKADSLGLVLIKTLMQQLSAGYSFMDNDGFGIRFEFPISNKGAHANI
ncbi:MAG: histidine kinase dimerization/phosphoacceptor domain -containing protein, partial [Chloroflexota bacterium]|nr:histidine kinase dimerization/phosphoacceptor domain -containing protein [Chloroflexota bacterium]